MGSENFQQFIHKSPQVRAAKIAAEADVGEKECDNDQAQTANPDPPEICAVLG
jgi:hypothetical protein